MAEQQETQGAEEASTAEGATTETTSTTGATHPFDLVGDGGDTATGADAADADTGTEEGAKPADKPDWLADEYWDADKGEARLEALAKQERYLRGKVSKGVEPPKSAADYTFEISDELKDKASLVLSGEDPAKDDPLMAKWREVAHKNGLNQEIFEAVAGDMIDFLAAEVGEHRLDPQEELDKLGKNGTALFGHMKQFGEQMEKWGAFSQDDLKEFWATCATADGLRMMHKVMHHFGDSSIPAIAGEAAVVTQDAQQLAMEMGELMDKAAQGDPHAQRKFEELQRKYQQLYGTDPAGTSIPLAS